MSKVGMLAEEIVKLLQTVAAIYERQKKLEKVAEAARRVVETAQQDEFDEQKLQAALAWLDAALAELEEAEGNGQVQRTKQVIR